MPDKKKTTRKDCYYYSHIKKDYCSWGHQCKRKCRGFLTTAQFVEHHGG